MYGWLDGMSMFGDLRILMSSENNMLVTFVQFLFLNQVISVCYCRVRFARHRARKVSLASTVVAAVSATTTAAAIT